MTAAALLELRQLLLTEIARVVRQAVRDELASVARLTQPQQRAVHALASVFGPEPFVSADAAGEWEHVLDTATRREYRAALSAMCRGQVPTAQRIGIALGAIVDATGTAGQWRLVEDGAEANSRRWRIEGVEPP